MQYTPYSTTANLYEEPALTSLPLFRKKLLIYTANFKVCEALAKVSITTYALHDTVVLDDNPTLSPTLTAEVQGVYV